MIKAMFDASDYLNDRTANAEDVVELACALVAINNLHEMGEVAFSSDNLLDVGQLAVIRQVLTKFKDKTNERGTHNLISLYRRLKQFNP